MNMEKMPGMETSGDQEPVRESLLMPEAVKFYGTYVGLSRAAKEAVKKQKKGTPLGQFLEEQDPTPDGVIVKDSEVSEIKHASGTPAERTTGHYRGKPGFEGLTPEQIQKIGTFKLKYPEYKGFSARDVLVLMEEKSAKVEEV